MPDSLEQQITVSPQPSPRWKPEKDKLSPTQDVPDGMRAELDEQLEPPAPSRLESDIAYEYSHKVAVMDKRPAEKEDFEIEEPPLQHAASIQGSHGIFWRSPMLMMAGFFAGSLACIGHHLFYSHFDGTIVGTANDQEWNIRIGNIFALAVKILLTASVWFAYTQCLWRTLKSKDISIRGLDSAFSVETSVIALLNPEMFLNVKLGALLALIAWCLQVPSLITPATLFVVPSISSVSVNASVPSLDITNSSEAHRFAYFTPLNTTISNADPNSYIFDGPRSILTRLSTATASYGQILPISPPFSDSSYSLSFAGPYVNCTSGNANSFNSTVQGFMELFLQKMNSSLHQSSLGEQFAYYAFVPSFDLDVEGSNTVFFNGTGLTALDQPRLQEQPGNATNELWITFYRYLTDRNGNYVLDVNQNKIPEQMYGVCSLWNVTYDLNFSYDGGAQNITNNSITPLNPVVYPTTTAQEDSNLVQLSYSAVFWVITDQLVGSMGLVDYTNSSQNGTSTPGYGSIDTNIEHNSLLGSNDLDYFFDLNAEVYNDTNQPLSDQRLLDKELGQNQTLPFLIEQLSYNVTMSLMNDPLLAPVVIANTTRITPVNRYSYSSRNLWLAYGLGTFFALIANAFGAQAFMENNASHNNSLSTLLSISRDPELANLFPECCHGKLPLPQRTMKARLRVEEMGDGGQSLKPKDTKRTVCEACKLQATQTQRPRAFSTWTIKGARARVSETSPLNPQHSM